MPGLECDDNASYRPTVARKREAVNIRIVGTLLVAFCVIAGSAAAQAPARPLAPVRVISFDGGWNLPVWAAQRQGFFEANGVAVQTSYTPSSGFLIASLFDGRQDIALALMDNLIAYQEGQGEVKIPEPPDLVAILGGDGGFLSVVAAPGVKSFADLKGKTLSVDALTTGAAFVLRELVAKNGLADHDVSYVRAGGTANRYADLARRQARCHAAAHTVRVARAESRFPRFGQRRNARSLPGDGRIRSTLVGRRRMRPRWSAS